jgi:hypothetical protein
LTVNENRSSDTKREGKVADNVLTACAMDKIVVVVLVWEERAFQ